MVSELKSWRNWQAESEQDEKLTQDGEGSGKGEREWQSKTKKEGKASRAPGSCAETGRHSGHAQVHSCFLSRAPALVTERLWHGPHREKHCQKGIPVGCSSTHPKVEF